MNFLIVGKNSFISNSVQCENDRISFSHTNNTQFKNYGSVLNCSIHPNYKEKKYDEQYDLDFHVAKKCSENNTHFIMLSTRRVYGMFDTLNIFDENSQVNPKDYYGENKLITENKIRKNFENHCILRCSNVYGLERNRKSFLSFCIDQLITDHKITYNISGKTKRDFIPVDLLSVIITKIVESKTKGLYNVGSSVGLEIEKVALHLIEGYGNGRFVQDGNDIKDQFILNNDKIKQQLSLEINVDFEKDLRNIGEKLCKI